MAKGWIISLKNWHVPLYVRAEMPEGHISWTGHKEEALRFLHRYQTYDFLSRLGETREGCIVRFTKR